HKAHFLPFGIKMADSQRSAPEGDKVMNLKTGLLAGACVILAVVAAVGWTHGRTIPNAAQPVYGQQPASSQPGDYTTANPAYPSSAPPNPTPDSSYVSPQPPPPYDSGAAYQSGGYYADAQY